MALESTILVDSIGIQCMQTSIDTSGQNMKQLTEILFVHIHVKKETQDTYDIS